MFPVSMFFLPFFSFHTTLIFYYFLFTPAFLFQLFLPHMIGPETASTIVIPVVAIDSIFPVAK